MPLWLILAAAIPEVPTTAVQVLKEGKVYVLRTLIDNKPLYTYDKDEPGKSNCTGACAAAWLPLWAPASAKPIGKWTTLVRADGSRQWVYDGKPIYSNVHDPEGVAANDKSGGVWHVLPSVPAD